MEIEMSRDDFKSLIKEKVLIPSILKDPEDAFALAREVLNPFVENDYIEGFDTDFIEEGRTFSIVVHFDSGEDLTFKISGDGK